MPFFRGATTASFLREPTYAWPPLLTTDNMTEWNGTWGNFTQKFFDDQQVS